MVRPIPSFQRLTSIQSLGSLILYFFLGCSCRSCSSTACSSASQGSSEDAMLDCVRNKLERDQSVKPLQTVQLIIIFVFGVQAQETRIPARGPNRHSDCSRDSCVRSIGGMPCACLTPSDAVWLAQCTARCFNLFCAWRKVTASTELT